MLGAHPTNLCSLATAVALKNCRSSTGVRAASAVSQYCAVGATVVEPIPSEELQTHTLHIAAASVLRCALLPAAVSAAVAGTGVGGYPGQGCVPTCFHAAASNPALRTIKSSMFGGKEQSAAVEKAQVPFAVALHTLPAVGTEQL